MLLLGTYWKPDILWSVNKLARSITKWTKACDKRLDRLISYIHHTCEYKQYCHVEILLNNADWNCFKTLTSRVSHSSTEAEIISLDAGLRLDGLPALELWDLIVSVFGTVTQTSDRTVRLVDTERSQKSQGRINVLQNIDCVPSHVQSSHQEALLYVFEDNEAVIKTIIKGRSPTMRRVSRTHRVAHDWLFDRINLDSKIQFKSNQRKFHTWWVESVVELV